MFVYDLFTCLPFPVISPNCELFFNCSFCLVVEQFPHINRVQVIINSTNNCNKTIFLFFFFFTLSVCRAQFDSQNARNFWLDLSSAPTNTRKEKEKENKRAIIVDDDEILLAQSDSYHTHTNLNNSALVTQLKSTGTRARKKKGKQFQCAHTIDEFVANSKSNDLTFAVAEFLSCSAQQATRNLSLLM